MKSVISVQKAHTDTLEHTEAAVGLERLGKLDHARHVLAVLGEVAP